MEIEFVGIRDGLFDEEIFSDLDSALKQKDSIKICVRVRSSLEIILKNVLASNNIVKFIRKGNSYVKPRDIAKSVWNKKLWRLLNEAYAADIINNEQFKSLDNLKKKCDDIIHNAYGVTLTENGQRELCDEIRPLFKHLLDINNGLRKEWKTNEEK